MVLGSTQALLGAVKAGAGVGLCLAGGPLLSGVGGLVRMLIVECIFCASRMAYHPARATGALREAFGFVRGWQKEGGNSQWLSST